MTPSCMHGFDADDVAQALSGGRETAESAAFRAHVDQCESCRRAAETASLAKRVWQRSIERDDAFALHAREQRLMSAKGVPRVRSHVWSVALAGVVLGALGTFVWSTRDAKPRASFDRSDAAALAPARAVASIEPAPSTTPTASAPALPDAVAQESLVTRRDCATCTRAGKKAVAAGATLRADEDVRVGRNATLMLSWRVDQGASDGQSTIDVDGPAVVRASPAGAAPFVLLVRGTARAETHESRELRTELARIHGDHAAFRVEARAKSTTVAGLRGDLVVEGIGPLHATRVVHAGEILDVWDDGRATIRGSAAPKRAIANAPASAEPSDADLFRESEEALKRGDRAGAEAALRTLTARGPGAGIRDRIALRLSELELARGERPEARARLESLLSATDRALAADAAVLLAHSYTAPAERADVWSRYIATSPPSPQREQASIARANALLDAGDGDGARAIARTLHEQDALPEVARAALRRLDDRLAAH